MQRCSGIDVNLADVEGVYGSHWGTREDAKAYPSFHAYGPADQSQSFQTTICPHRKYIMRNT